MIMVLVLLKYNRIDLHLIEVGTYYIENTRFASLKIQCNKQYII